MDTQDLPNIEKMAAEQDVHGLEQALHQGDEQFRLRVAMALAELYDSEGWRYLMDAAFQNDDPEIKISAAEILRDLDPQRALPILKKVLIQASAENAQAIVKVIESIGGREADRTLREAGYEPVLPHMSGNLQLVDYGGEYVRSIRPEQVQVTFLSAAQHHDLAVELREGEMAERGLVENALALWLAPEWAYAWYLRGVLFEDLERQFEAVLCYRWALELDPKQADARDALDELETIDATNISRELDEDRFLRSLRSPDWRERRDAAAGLGDIGENVPEEAVERLIGLLHDGEREVRHAAIEALGNIGSQRAVKPLLAAEETSWLLRFAVIEALAQLGTVAGLATVLRREIDRIPERNPVFSSEKDPLLEVEYGRLMEVGALAFEKAGDLEALMTLVEDNAWEVVAEEPNQDEDQDAEEGGEQAQEELAPYVDEVAVMAGLALERLALPRLGSLSEAVLRRLADIPDLTLLDPADEAGQPAVVHDLGSLREAARAALESG